MGDHKDALYQWTVDEDGRNRSSSQLDAYFGVNQVPAVLLETLDLNQLKGRKKCSLQPHFVDLPDLSGWMEKQSASGLKPWQKRWCIVRRTHLLWAKQKTNTEDPNDPAERRKFANSITLLTVKQVRAVNTKRKRKFDIVTPAKTYHFKCATKEERERWIHGLRKHLDALAMSMMFLQQSPPPTEVF